VSRALRVGTRGSELALWQARHVAEQLEKRTGTSCELRIIHTRGDADRSRALWELDGVGFFTRELQAALLGSEVDVVVHSLKDLPMEEPEGLAIGAILARVDPRELLLARRESLGSGALGLRGGATLGTSSLRRAGFALAAQPDVTIRPLRGNVPTRVRRLREGAYDAILLAAAGVERLGLDVSDLFARRCELAEILPAPGQGALAVEFRAGDGSIGDAVGALHEPGVAEATACERAVLAGLGGGCHLPLGAFAVRRGDRLELEAGLAQPDAAMARATLRRVSVSGEDAAAAAGAALAELEGVKA
jgi:hydroxymethylbilane synthase